MQCPLSTPMPTLFIIVAFVTLLLLQSFTLSPSYYYCYHIALLLINSAKQVFIHPFFQGLSHFYGLQLHHLNPNSILHIACFIMICEFFLGVEPHFGLWRKYFEVKHQTNGDETCEYGSAAVCKQAKSGYLAGEFSEINKKWQ
jgi:hypothetical protein